MWPFRADKLTDLLSEDDIRFLLAQGRGFNATVVLCEPLPDGGVRIIAPERQSELEQPDPFCTFFRFGQVSGRAAFDGADAACCESEEKFARLFFKDDRYVAASGEGGVARKRCHMGLTNSQVPVEVGGRVLASLIGGRRVAHDDDRVRIRKSVGKLGKLTKAEQERFEKDTDYLVVRPQDESAREQLLQEIPTIPPCSDTVDRALQDLAGLVRRFAEQRLYTYTRKEESRVVDWVARWPRHLPATAVALREVTTTAVEELRSRLQLEFIAVFAGDPGQLQGHLPLAAEAGLQTVPGESGLTLEWKRLAGAGPRAPVSPDAAAVARGLDCVSATVNALRQADHSPAGLKDRLTKSQFFFPVTVTNRFRVAVAFGPGRIVEGAPASQVEPREDDYLFLVQIARHLARRSCALALALAAASSTDELNALRKRVATLEEAARDEAGLRGQRFDLRKLVDRCVAKVLPKAEEKKLEIDTRELAPRAMVHGERREIQQAVNALLAEGLSRSCALTSEAAIPPLRVFLRRRRDRVLFGVEVVGLLLDRHDRRRLFRRGGEKEKQQGARESATESAANAEVSTHPAEDRGTLRMVQDVIRAHRGRFRSASERLERFPDDSKRWLAKTTFLVLLNPAPRLSGELGQPKPKGPPEQAPEKPKAASSARRRRKRRRRRPPSDAGPKSSPHEE